MAGPFSITSLADDIVERQSESDREVVEGTLTNIMAGVGVITTLKSAKKFLSLPKPSKYSSRVSALEYAKLLVQAKNPKQTIVATVALLNICARVLMSVPELRDLGHRVQKVVNSERFEDFLE